jgi:hypothetical protein
MTRNQARSAAITEIAIHENMDGNLQANGINIGERIDQLYSMSDWDLATLYLKYFDFDWRILTDAWGREDPESTESN